jgi:hypothetical protein
MSEHSYHCQAAIKRHVKACSALTPEASSDRANRTALDTAKQWDEQAMTMTEPQDPLD